MSSAIVLRLLSFEYAFSYRTRSAGSSTFKSREVLGQPIDCFAREDTHSYFALASNTRRIVRCIQTKDPYHLASLESILPRPNLRPIEDRNSLVA